MCYIFLLYTMVDHEPGNGQNKMKLTRPRLSCRLTTLIKGTCSFD